MPDWVPAMTARMTSAIVSVSTVAPTALAMTGSLASPALRMSGYSTSVCDASSEPSSSDAASDQPSAMPAIVPNTIGNANVSSPNVIAPFR